MKIYTKTGDEGLTSLIGGTRVPKYDLRIESYGTVDELNSYIGMIRDHDIDAAQKDVLKEVQDRLFTIGAALASDPEKSKMKIPDLHLSDITFLENQIDEMNLVLPELKHFILPGGSPVVSFCHVSRCVCRRAERIIVHLKSESFVDEKVVVYLNRLSDYLFVLARKLCFDRNVPENQWFPRV
ncbi:cob(I)yrinic acid a,c-diamide adenosyltransferase [Daejeonella sp.]|jgi:cob(I)alamin adenosyltransferase|uniref:cob(I)yrinic acid a,c-diamide adenosyltransferase n=1 Tax=Daejeonella sp. TaxID=2805397 RepID=UPI0025C68BF5|nr:cob(I)yrinic acid a,c-diamide adenosyltransferase [Daejeonella sp.]